MNIMHICNMTTNGKAVVVCELIKNNDYNKNNITILNVHGKIDTEIKERINNYPVKVISPKNGILPSVFALIAELRKNHYDVVHSHMHDLSGIYVTVSKCFHVQTRISHSHNSNKIRNRQDIIGKIIYVIRDKILWKILQSLLIRNSTTMVGCSNLAGEWLFKNIDRDNYFTIYNPVDTSKFNKNYNVTKIITKYNLSTKKHLLFVGRLEPQKNPFFLIDIMKKLVHSYPNVDLLIVGGGGYYETMQDSVNTAQLSEYIKFIGKVDNPAELMNVCSMLLMPSLYEGFPIVLAEAQLCGLRSIASENVTKEIQLGGVDYFPIDNGANVWAERIEYYLINEPSWQLLSNRAELLRSEVFAKNIYELYV